MRWEIERERQRDGTYMSVDHVTCMYVRDIMFSVCVLYGVWCNVKE